MKILTTNDFQEIRSWVYRNAREIELSLWKYYFENGSKEAVLSALAFYQNEDGGFGQALEPDSWNPESTPYTTLFAANILRFIDFNDKKHPLMSGILKFFESNKFFSECGWNFNIPSNNNYPHAPWWTYDITSNAIEGVGLTAEIVSFLLMNADRESNLFNKALKFADIIIGKLNTSDKYGEMGLGGYCKLLETIKRTGFDSRYDYKQLLEILRSLVQNTIERDTTKWIYHTPKPSNYIKSPESIFYEENKDIVQTELDYLIDTRPQNGVWDIDWSWFENNDKYAKEFAISENWWKAYQSIERVNFLKSFNRLEKVTDRKI